MAHGDPDGCIGGPSPSGHGSERRPAPDGRAGAQALSAASRRAARDGVGRGLRALYADSLDAPLTDDLRDLLGRFGAPGP